MSRVSADDEVSRVSADGEVSRVSADEQVSRVSVVDVEALRGEVLLMSHRLGKCIQHGSDTAQKFTTIFDACHHISLVSARDIEKCR